MAQFLTTWLIQIVDQHVGAENATQTAPRVEDLCSLEDLRAILLVAPLLGPTDLKQWTDPCTESALMSDSRTGLPSGAADLSSGDPLQCDGFSGTQCSHVQAWKPAHWKRHCSAMEGRGQKKSKQLLSSLTLAKFLRISFFTVFTFIRRACKALFSCVW